MAPNIETSADAPAISVVIVCDHAAGNDDGWTDTRKTLAALAVQDAQEPAEFILCESEEFREKIPTDLTEILPALKILLVAGHSSYELKNAAVEAASCELIAMLDADCVPNPDWLRRLLQSLRTHPLAVAISGKTTYGGTSLAMRAVTLLSRAYADPGRDGPSWAVSDNNAGYRRSAYLAHPLPTHLGGFAAHVQSEEFRRHGLLLWFDAGIRVVHGYDGWSTEKDIRRNRGYSTVNTRLLEPSLPFTWPVRLGPIGIAPIVARNIRLSWRECRRCGPSYGIRWYELPLVMLASVGLNLLEIPGMLAAFRGSGLGKTQFR